MNQAFIKKHAAVIFLFAIILLAVPLMGQQVVNGRTGVVYTTIQAAINAASNGDTLLVSPATYPGNITINKSLNIKGANKDTTIINGNGLADAVQITASNARLTGFTIQITYSDPYYYYGPPYAGVKITSTATNNKVEGNNIRDCYRAFFLEGGSNSGNRICNNVITNDVVGMLVPNYYSFWINGSSGNKIYNNTISSTLNQTGWGITLSGSSSNEIYGNDIYNNDYGIYLYQASNYNLIHHNNFNNVSFNAYTENYLGQCIGNQWYLVSTLIGNHWSNHTSPDSNNNGIVDTPYYIPGGTDQDTYPLVAQSYYPIYNSKDLVVRTSDARLLMFPFNNGTFAGTGKQVGNGWNDYTHFFVGHWNTDYPTHDLIALKSTGDLNWFPYRNETFYTYGIKRLLQNFSFSNYFVGNWTDNATDDLLVIDSSGNMWLYPFENEVFGTPISLGSGWNNYTHYFVGNWSGNGVRDLICRDSAGYMWYFRYQNGAFAARQQVGNGWNFTHYFVGNWTNDGSDDLIVRSSNGNVYIYPFRNESFYNVPGAGTLVATGWNYTDYYVGDWSNSNLFIDDMIARDSNGNLILYPFVNGTFGTGTTAGTGFTTTNYTNLLVGQWTNN